MKQEGAPAPFKLFLWQNKFLPGDLTNPMAIIVSEFLLHFSCDGNCGDLGEVSTPNILYFLQYILITDHFLLMTTTTTTNSKSCT